MRELEIYSGIEPIGGMVGVSEPAEPASEEMTASEANSMFDRIKRSFGRKGK